jgi:hypothetical protein
MFSEFLPGLKMRVPSISPIEALRALLSARRAK